MRKSETRDPAEVAEVEVWPLDLSQKTKQQIKRTLARAEYTVFKKLLNASKLKAILNEKEIRPTKPIALPQSYRRRIVSSGIFAPYVHELATYRARLA